MNGGEFPAPDLWFRAMLRTEPTSAFGNAGAKFEPCCKWWEWAELKVSQPGLDHN